MGFKLDFYRTTLTRVNKSSERWFFSILWNFAEVSAEFCAHIFHMGLMTAITTLTNQNLRHQNSDMWQFTLKQLDSTQIKEDVLKHLMLTSVTMPLMFSQILKWWRKWRGRIRNTAALWLSTTAWLILEERTSSCWLFRLSPVRHITVKWCSECAPLAWKQREIVSCQ